MAETGRLEEAAEAARRIPDPRERVQVLMTVAERLVQEGRKKEAAALFEEGILSAPTDWVSLSQVALTMKRTGFEEWAKELIHIVIDGLKPQKVTFWFFQDPVGGASGWKGLAEILVREGLSSEAENILQKLWQASRNAGRNPIYYWDLAQTAAQLGFPEVAREFAEKIAKDDRFGIYNTLWARVERGEKANVLAVLPLCAWSMPRALDACAVLVHLYPSHAFSIARAVQDFLTVLGLKAWGPEA